MQFLRQVTANGRAAAWTLHLDVASFFPSIHKPTLYAILARHCRHPEVLWLRRTILFHDPTTNYRFRTLGREAPPDTPGYPVPARKSLFGRGNEHGLPIGNLTSQFWGNVYLNEVDQFVKRVLKCRHYVRYVDDLVLLSCSPAELARWRDAIGKFLAERLRLTLRDASAEPMPAGGGVEFVGWRTWWNRRIPRRQTLQRVRRRIYEFERRCVRPAFGGAANRIELRASSAVGLRSMRARYARHGWDGVEPLAQSLASYAGHLRHGAAWCAWVALWSEHPSLRLLYWQDGWSIARRWPLRPVVRTRPFRQRYADLVRRAGDDLLVFVRVGRYVEFYGPQRVLAERVLGLRRVWLPRAGYAFTVGFPVWLTAQFVQRALARDIGVMLPPGQGGRACVIVAARHRSASPNSFTAGSEACRHRLIQTPGGGSRPWLPRF